jgi:transcriptional antiterminator NusG
VNQDPDPTDLPDPTPDEEAAETSETPIADALERAADVHEIADEAADEILGEAAQDAEDVREAADETAEQILDEASHDAARLDGVAREDDADAAMSDAEVEAETVEDLGEAVADEILAEAAIEATVAEETADEIGQELVAEAAAGEPAAASRADRGDPAPISADGEGETGGDDPFRGPGDWYVVHTYAGYENKVKTNLESRIHTMQMEGKIFGVHIPMEDVMEIKSGKRQVVQKKVFPGYLLVKMTYDNDSWYVVRNTPGVTGFVSAGTGSKPTPLSRREVEKILAVKKEEAKPQFRLGFEENDVVQITSGPFADFSGTISEINVDQNKLKVLVNIFDRETPVELGFDQVSKV